MLLLHASRCSFQLHFTGISLFLVLCLGRQCCLDACARLWCSRWSSYQTCPWRWALLCDFLCSFSWWQLAQVYISLWDSLQGFLTWQLLHKEDAKLLLCSGLSASRHQTVGAAPRLQSHKSVRQHRAVQLIAPFLVVFFTPSKTALQGTFERCSGSPHPTSSWLCIDCAVSRRAKVQPGSWFLFSESLSVGHPRNIALGNEIKLKHERGFCPNTLCLST